MYLKINLNVRMKEAALHFSQRDKQTPYVAFVIFKSNKQQIKYLKMSLYRWAGKDFHLLILTTKMALLLSTRYPYQIKYQPPLSWPGA